MSALADLFVRYWEVFSRAWKERKNLEPANRTPHEAQFLPAALELMETPLSPAPRAAMGLLVAFAVITALWAVFGRIDVVAVAPGKVVPNDRTKIIQSFDTATVVAIHVADGDEVSAGALLIELDAASTQADVRRLSLDLLNARWEAARAQAMLDAFANEAPWTIHASTAPDPERLEQEQRILEGHYGDFQAKLTRIDADIARREAEYQSTREVVRKLERTLPMTQQRARDFQSLVAKNFVSRHAYLEKEQARIEQEADLATQKSRLKALLAALDEGRSQRRAFVAETRRLALDTLEEARQKIAAHAQELIKAETRHKRMRLIAPVDGTVQQLSVHTLGGVVTEAQPLMMLVPRDHPIEVDALLENRDIGFVAPGQEAIVKVETFPFTKYGTLEAIVHSVSNDAVSDEKRGLVSPMRVTLKQTSLLVENRPVKLSPGMAVTVEVKTSQRRVIEYFLSPLLQYKDESLRER
jgi:hemolysin D